MFCIYACFNNLFIILSQILLCTRTLLRILTNRQCDHKILLVTKHLVILSRRPSSFVLLGSFCLKGLKPDFTIAVIIPVYLGRRPNLLLPTESKNRQLQLLRPVSCFRCCSSPSLTYVQLSSWRHLGDSGPLKSSTTFLDLISFKTNSSLLTTSERLALQGNSISRRTWITSSIDQSKVLGQRQQAMPPSPPDFPSSLKKLSDSNWKDFRTPFNCYDSPFIVTSRNAES